MGCRAVEERVGMVTPGPRNCGMAVERSKCRAFGILKGYNSRLVAFTSMQALCLLFLRQGIPEARGV